MIGVRFFSVYRVVFSMNVQIFGILLQDSVVTAKSGCHAITRKCGFSTHSNFGTFG